MDFTSRTIMDLVDHFKSLDFEIYVFEIHPSPMPIWPTLVEHDLQRMVVG